ncbi:hypothetical protein HYR99_05545 [Candidatus Poribacteria bacterium]|nr:hypothetical protein [Candidatus Poribacteria bacterium]
MERILYSGGAPGADSLFGTFAEPCGITEQNYSFRDHVECRSRGRVILTPEQLSQADAELQEVMGDTFTYCLKTQNDPGYAMRLRYWRRNWYQVKHTPEVFAVLNNRTFLDFTKDPPDGAGVAIAVGMLKRDLCKRICVYLQTDSAPQWLEWMRNPDHGGEPVNIPYVTRVSGKGHNTEIPFFSVTPSAIKIGTGDFTGIGTREINRNGMRAVADLYKRSFPERFAL